MAGARPAAKLYSDAMADASRWQPGRGLALLVLALMSWGLAPGADAFGDSTGPADRDAVWRSIFARPAPPPVAASPELQARIALGHDLFRDVRLSGSSDAACASCHDPERFFTDGRKTAIGHRGAVLSRNVPALYDLAWATSFFWDGRAGDLESQARVPILAPDELAGDFPTIERRLAADPAMAARFAAAFPGTGAAPTEGAILEALAAYERTLVSPETRFDLWVGGDDTAFTGAETQGFAIFVGKGGCVSCHGGWRFTDGGLHDIGLPAAKADGGSEDGPTPGLGAIKTPSLRQVAHTAPYMHDGRFATLAEVVRHYAGGVTRRPTLAPTLVPDLALTAEEQAALVAFLGTLSSQRESRTADETPRPMLEK